MSLLHRQPPALLVLEDGTVYEGRAFAGRGEAFGECVFNTAMTGYQEVITDPSYKGQIVAMTYPLVGASGINPDDMESGDLHLEGFVVREYQSHPSNWRSRQSLQEFLEAAGKLAVEGIDTRALTRRLRTAGVMRGVISTESRDTEALVARVREYPGLVGRDLVQFVTCRDPYRWQDGRRVAGLPAREEPPASREGKTTVPIRVVVIDCGVKYNILRSLDERGCDVVVVPAATRAEDVLALSPDGVLLSNGPGDPEAVPYVVATARRILGRVPLFGICLGHQILGLALGGRTAKLKFGHHGINQPVQNRESGRVEITSQNHGFVVLPETLPAQHRPTHGNLNDCTSEGIALPPQRAFSVQYHPEAAPGPHDATYLFDQFVQTMETWRSATPGRRQTPLQEERPL